MGLVAWYKLDGDAYDSGGKGLNGINYGGNVDFVTTTDNSVLGSSAYFNGGTDDRITINSVPAYLDGNRSHSIFCWLKKASAATNAIISINSSDGSTNPILFWTKVTTGKLDMYINNAGFKGEGTTNVCDGYWHHVGYVFDTIEDEVRIYVDGALDKTYASETTSGISSTNIMTIGADADAGPVYNDELTGYINDVRIYDHALSLREIQEISRCLIFHVTGNESTYTSYTSFGIIEPSTIDGGIVHDEINHRTGTGCIDTSGGSGSGVTYGDPDILGLNTSCSICFWMYCNNIASPSRQNPWAKAYGGEGTLTLETTGALNLFWGTTGANSGTLGVTYTAAGTDTSFITNGVWIHVAIVRDNASYSVTWYKNGSYDSTDNPVWLTATRGSLDFIIGDGYTNQFNGLIDDFRIYNSVLSADEVGEIYGTSAQIDNHGNLFTKELQEGGDTSSRMVNYRTWTIGTGSVTGFNINGLAAENERKYGSDPWERPTIIWECIPSGVGDADGGWYTSVFNIDNTKLYRFSTWVRRTVLGTAGRAYFGLLAYGTTNGVAYLSTGVETTNPYFWSTSGTPTTDELPDEWILVVGFVYPYTWTGTSNNADSGRWYLDGTQKTTGGTGPYDFRWLSSTTTASHRAYLYYSTTDTTVRQRFVYPRVDLVDGNEPSVAELIDGFYEDTGQNFIAKKKFSYSPKFSEEGPAGDALEYYWPMNGHLLDYGSHEESLTNNGATATQGGPRDRGYYAFASTDYMDCPWGNGINPYPLTISVWCTGTTSSDMVFGTSAGTNQRLYVGTYSDSKWTFGVASTAWASDDFTASAGWNHLALTLTDPAGGTGSANLYVNGQLDDRTITYSAFSLASDIDIGNASGLTYYWQGNIMDFRIYNRVLTSQEINILAKMFDADSPVTQQMLSSDAWYSLGKFKESV